MDKDALVMMVMDMAQRLGEAARGMSRTIRAHGPESSEFRAEERRYARRYRALRRLVNALANA